MKRYGKTVAQQCRYYKVSNIFEYMVETYLNDNITTFEKLYREPVQGGKKGFYRLPAQRGGADILERDFKNNNLMNKSIEYERNI